jgi:hypothetical protein
MKRLRHLPTVWSDTEPRRHNSVAGLALASQYDLRPQRQGRRQRTRARDRQRCARSSFDIVSTAFGRPVRIGYLLQSGYPKPMQKLCYELTGRNTS